MLHEISHPFRAASRKGLSVYTSAMLDRFVAVCHRKCYSCQREQGVNRYAARALEIFINKAPTENPRHAVLGACIP
jgi:hypothetical protein